MACETRLTPLGVAQPNGAEKRASSHVICGKATDGTHGTRVRHRRDARLEAGKFDRDIERERERETREWVLISGHHESVCRVQYH
jgi:hypothetical protein